MACPNSHSVRMDRRSSWSVAVSNKVGTNAWASSGGELRRQDRVRLIGQALLTRISALPGRLRARLRFSDAASRRIDLSAIRLPDSPVALRAGEHARSLSEPWLFYHCLRTYVWGAMLAQSDRIKFDHELLFVASALHDLGLTDAHKCQEHNCTCFAVEGARAAHRFVAAIGWENERRDRLAEAISLHLNVRVGLQHGPEAHLLHEGAALDVIGARVREIGPTAVTAVLKEYPRLGLKEQMVAEMKEQARIRPRSRAAFLVGLGFVGLIRSAALENAEWEESLDT